MQKIGNTTNTADKNGEFTDGDPQKQISCTWIMAAWLNTLQRELIKVVQEGGLTLDPNDDTQLYKAIEKLMGTAVSGVVRSVNTHEPDASGNVKLGTAADADVGKDLPGQVLTVGNYGLANTLTALDSTDLNTLQTFGFYVVRNSVNGPVGSNPGTVFLKVITWQSGNGASGYRVIQEVIGYGASASTGNRVWRRTWTGTIWTGWVEFYSEAYKPTAVDTNALPLTGGTVTGPTTFQQNV
ncbi:MAG: pyocin knob domain-containing protein, partial [Serratia proteamaculans]